MILSLTESYRPENNGLQPIRLYAIELLLLYGIFGVTAADLIQFMAAVAIATCPLGPRIRTFVGRDNSALSPTGLLPNVNSNAATLINLFSDKTFTPDALVALLGAHTTSNQFYVSPPKAGAPQDTTPGIWDASFFSEMLSSKPAAKVYQFSSDLLISNATQTKGTWHSFADPVVGQNNWNLAFSKAFVRLSLLGVNKINKLTDVSR
jgi:manganese peroxidase